MQRFEYFTDVDVQKIHEATLRVLETVGVDFGYAPAVDVLKKGGCKVDGKRVFFPAEVVMEQVAKAPSEYTLQARNPEKNVIIGGDHIAYIPCYGPPFVHDLDRGRRESTLEDYTNFVKLAYASKSMDITGGMMAEPNDIPNARRNAEMMYASMRYSDKPFMGGAIGAEAARETIEMAAIVFGCSESELAGKMPMARNPTPGHNMASTHTKSPTLIAVPGPGPWDGQCVRARPVERRTGPGPGFADVQNHHSPGGMRRRRTRI